MATSGPAAAYRSKAKATQARATADSDFPLRPSPARTAAPRARASVAPGRGAASSAAGLRPSQVPAGTLVQRKCTDCAAEQSNPVLRAKLEVGAVDCPLEREADAIADYVTSMPTPSATGIGPATTGQPGTLQRKCAPCEDEDKLHRTPAPGAVSETIAPPIVRSVLEAPGQPLDSPARAFMEPRFGHDFSGVRIHADARAAASARAVGALAYTVNEHVVLAADRDEFTSSKGRKLLAHELAHVVQQRGRTGTLQRLADQPDNGETKSAQPDDGVTKPAQPDDAKPESASAEAGPPELSALTAKVDELKATVVRITRDQDPLASPEGRTEIGGETRCDPTTGQPQWAINRSVVPSCLWPCAEIHEQTHAEFMRLQCGEVGIAFGRTTFWLHVAEQYLRANNPKEADRAAHELETAVREASQAVARYLRYMEQTCRYDEGMAYEAGINACDTDEARSRCAAAGQSDQYRVQMAAWRRFMQNPPNCAAVGRP